MGMLYDKGLFKFEDKISKYWPEFGQNGKEELRICDVLRHESGLGYFTESLSSIEGKGPSINDIRYFWVIFDPPPPPYLRFFSYNKGLFI